MNTRLFIRLKSIAMHPSEHAFRFIKPVTSYFQNDLRFNGKDFMRLYHGIIMFLSGLIGFWILNHEGLRFVLENLIKSL
jgi:hypothetical protein